VPDVVALLGHLPGDVADQARERDEKESALFHPGSLRVQSRRKLRRDDYAPGRRAAIAADRLRVRERGWHTFETHWFARRRPEMWRFAGLIGVLSMAAVVGAAAAGDTDATGPGKAPAEFTLASTDIAPDRPI